MIWKLWFIFMALSGAGAAVTVAAALVFGANSDNKNEAWWTRNAREKRLAELFFWSACWATAFGAAAWVIWP